MMKAIYNNEPLPNLEFDKNRYRVKFCPCGKSNRDGKFIPYKGYENSGYCHSCEQTYLPDLTIAGNKIPLRKKQNRQRQINTNNDITFIPTSKFDRIITGGIQLYDQNHFIQWLGSKNRKQFAFSQGVINSLIETYFLGNPKTGNYKGWTLFPYIDIHERVRDIKAMDYNPVTGRRIKEPFPRVLFLGKKILANPNANTIRCFYGEHLLKDNAKPVMIFESEATATYAAPFFPDHVCLATGGKNGCKWTLWEQCKVLQGRIITLYPDIDAHESWEQKSEILREYGLDVQVSSLIKGNALKYAQQNGIEYEDLVNQKYDLRDILQFKVLPDIVKPKPTPSLNHPELQHLYKSTEDIRDKSTQNNYELPVSEISLITKDSKPLWNISELEKFFSGVELPEEPISLTPGVTITNLLSFIESHLAIITEYNGNRCFMPYYSRLLQVKSILEEKLNIHSN